LLRQLTTCPPRRLLVTTMQVPHDSWMSPKIEVRSSSTHGKGTFATGPIDEGEIVEIWGEWWKGKRTVEYTDRRDRVEVARREGKAVMQWDDNLFSIEERGADDGYFINHSCDANLWFRDPFTLEARKPIAPGEEVTLDYALFERAGYIADWACSCGSALCRHRVTGQDWRRPDLQARYRDHFSPLINKKIDSSRKQKG
jgi:SET domain-containing protein